jgi:hypothetical protein
LRLLLLIFLKNNKINDQMKISGIQKYLLNATGLVCLVVFIKKPPKNCTNHSVIYFHTKVIILYYLLFIWVIQYQLKIQWNMSNIEFFLDHLWVNKKINMFFFKDYLYDNDYVTWIVVCIPPKKMGVECLNIVSEHARSLQHIMVVELLNSVMLPSAQSSLVGSMFSLVLFSFTCLLRSLFLPLLLSLLTWCAHCCWWRSNGNNIDAETTKSSRRHTNEQWMKLMTLSIHLYFS